MKNDITSVWKEIKSLINSDYRHSHTIKEINCNGDVITDPLQIATKFNEYFVNIGPNLANSIPPVNGNYLSTILRNNSSMFVYPSTPNEVISVTSQLKSNKSAGYDGIEPMVIKNIIQYIASPLSDIINKSFTQGYVPDKLKIAKVIPLHKSDDKCNISNYRPISVLPVFSKILEKIMYCRLSNFLTSNNTICPNQYGFREKHSTYMALLNLIDKISEQLDNKKYSLGIFIDLSKPLIPLIIIS